MNETPTAVLIVIPCLNEARYIERLVTGLQGDAQALDARIVIADGGSSDGTILVAEQLCATFPNVILLPNPKRLQSAAVNLAVTTYGQDVRFVIRLDAHADYPADYCRQLVDEAKRTGADAVVVAMRTVGYSCFQRAVAAAQNSKLGNGGAAHRGAGEQGRWIDHGHHALMRVHPFIAVGGYDDTFSHNEDAELDLRLVKAGCKIWLTGKTSLTYYPRAALSPLMRQYAGFGGGRAKTLLKHRQRPKPRQLLPVIVLPALLLALLAPLLPVLALPVLLWVLLCLALGAGLALRHKSICVLLAGPAALAMHSAWSFGFWRQLAAQQAGRR